MSLSSWCVFSVALTIFQFHGEAQPPQPKLYAQSSLPFSSCPASLTLSLLFSCCYNSARASLQHLHASSGTGKNEHLLGIVASLHLKIHFKMPAHLLSTFMYAVDLICDLSYLIKCFLKRYFCYCNQLIVENVWSWLLLKPKGKSISIIELFKISDLSSSSAFWWVKLHIQAKSSRPGERLQFAVWGRRILEFCEQFRGPVFYTSSNCLSTQSHKNEKVYLASP